jgi:hypothetical protein
MLRHSLMILLIAGLACLVSAGASAQRDDDIDWNRARILRELEQKGQPLTPEEHAYLERAKAQFNRQQNLPPTPPPRDSTGLIPLDQLKEKYRNFDGGLYGNGANDPPPDHLKAALAAASQIVPLDQEAKPSREGKIVLLSIGMSNTTMEFSRFKQLADADLEKSPKLLIVDGAQGGKDAAAWIPASKSDTNPVWDEADRRLRRAGADPRQVQAVWIKQALIGPGRYPSAGAHLKTLEDDLVKIVDLAHRHYPNLKLAYLSSRIYAGYAKTPLNPEPHAYESAFAVRAVAQRQIAHDPSVSSLPVILWGPYLWADGTKGRKSDTLVWNPEDFAGDGTHPNESGRQKVAGLLLMFFKNDPTARTWFLREPGHAPDLPGKSADR